MEDGQQLWRRPGFEAAIGTKLLPPEVPIYFSELDLETRLALPYHFGIFLGELAGEGKLSYDMHPDNIIFKGVHLHRNPQKYPRQRLLIAARTYHLFKRR